mgnify:CR=1 FL=1
MNTPTERDLWLVLADIWENRVTFYNNSSSLCWVASNGDVCFGLCGCIQSWNAEYVLPDTIRSMVKKIRKLPDYNLGGGFYSAYKWPMDESGRKQRVQFCKQMAELTK